MFDTEHDDLFKLIDSIAEYKGQLEKELFRTGFLFQLGDSRITYHKTLPLQQNQMVKSVILSSDKLVRYTMIGIITAKR